jgi:hypothetical protein
VYFLIQKICVNGPEILDQVYYFIILPYRTEDILFLKEKAYRYLVPGTLFSFQKLIRDRNTIFICSSRNVRDQPSQGTGALVLYGIIRMTFSSIIHYKQECTAKVDAQQEFRILHSEFRKEQRDVKILPLSTNFYVAPTARQNFNVVSSRSHKVTQQADVTVIIKSDKFTVNCLLLRKQQTFLV